MEEEVVTVCPVLIHTVGGFTYAAYVADIPGLRETTDYNRTWTDDKVLEYWTLLSIRKGLLYLPGSKEGIGIRNATIRVRDIISIEDTDAVEVVV